MKLGRTIGRAVIGGLFIGHGTQKLFGWFGGAGPDATGQFFESAGIRPGRRHALLSGATEAAAGAMLVAGAATPLATAAISGVMLTAIRKVHLGNGPWSTNGGYEYNLVLLAILAALAEEGPGSLSVDHALGIERRGARWALASLAAGAAGSQLALTVGSRDVHTVAGDAAADTPAAEQDRQAA